MRFANVIYGIYAVLAFLFLGSIALVLVTLVPGLGINARRAIAHHAAKSFFHTAGIRVRVLGQDQLPTTPCVVVANHASYIDGVVLKAFLPARFSFVIKKEVTKVPLAGLLLRRIGSEFVDRFNRHAGGMDARRLIKAADAGQALAFFPEGTFVERPGVGKFHTGAFAIAARVGVPVVPVAIRGTRHILPSGRFLPRFGRIDIDILPALPAPAAADPSAVHTVRDQARERIVAAVDEPDLAQDDGVAAIGATRKSPSGARL
ncbi:MAG TPA: lysophospholipid acyltransferase family protein [Steroidobacteraceae bacterium]|nr:lysophospholipid acyltransferase family protein [Steroidobacteraceae bacterium]